MFWCGDTIKCHNLPAFKNGFYKLLPHQNLLKNTKGFLDEEEGRRLYDIALEAGRLGPCLEIGSYCGKSAIYLGAACKEAGTILFSIDHHKGSEEQQPGQDYFDPELFDAQTGCVDTFNNFRKTITSAGLEDTVVPMVCKSEVAARLWATPLSLVFIDGGHTYKAAFTDYKAWVGQIIHKGYLLFHDIFQDSAKGGQAPYQVYSIAVASGLFQELPMTKTLGVLQRRI
ncbi:MAG: class I SAM-dependent methyltransferase [Desulfobacterales bacterium]|nr:class I SAM-dependent methyltransferase [Deltaproteobacteria bacterium]MBT8374339.1 class I SAM-dependent methyltransferase [Deltaproteobacteria bacterium]NNK85327.1 class I SAM-dependent methyltransferase [Desulfobacterales bacterium]NNL43589.1 class I SAM-dependent methyltransferase [Desulfobacterales bacterium]